MRLTAVVLASLSLIALVHVVPSVAADTQTCVQIACAEEASVGDPTCADPNSWGYRYTQASADDGFVGAYVGGDAWCSRWDDQNSTETGQGKDVYAFADVPAGFVYADWGSFNDTMPGWGTFSGCEIFATYWLEGVGGMNYAPCVAGDPVDPGWGSLLP